MPGWLGRFLGDVRMAGTLAHEALSQGGIIVETRDRDAAVIRTVTQLDGDMVTMVDWDRIKDLTTDQRDALRARHAAALRRRLSIPVVTHEDFVTFTSWARRLVWAGSGTSGGAALLTHGTDFQQVVVQGLTAAGGGLMTAAMHTLVAFAIPHGLHFVVRRAMPLIAGAYFRGQTRRALA